MIVPNGLGDDSSGDLIDFSSSDFPSTLLWIGFGLVVLVSLTGGPFFKRSRSSTQSVRSSRRTRVRESGMSQNQREVVDALVGQGASKSQAKEAVKRASGSDFESLFRSALRQL